jgi:glycosyltransferase involved in cell wall biosynthesis
VILKVSVIISTFSIKRERYIISCINSLRKQIMSPDEIILVLDPEVDLIEFYKSRLPSDVKIIVSDGFGLSNARNAGLKNAKGEIVAFIDDDAEADERWLESLVKNYEDPYVVGVGGPVKPLWENGRPAWFPEELDWIVGCTYKGLPEYRTIIRNPIGCNMSFRREVFKKVGFFKTEIGRIGKKLLAGEEAEFSLRIKDKIPDSKIIFEPAAIVYHRVDKHKMKLGYLLERSFYEGFS